MSSMSDQATTSNRDIELLYELGTLRHVNRTWIQFLCPDFQNVTEHTYRVLWLSLMIASHYPKIDQAKMMKMALVHDITETRTGDVHYISRQYVTRHEQQAIEDILAGTGLGAEFLQVYHEYEERQSIEAKIVKDADNLDVDLELKEQAAMGNRLDHEFREMRQHVAETQLFTPEAKEMWQRIQTANPHTWHLNGRNRFKSGDWKKK